MNVRKHTPALALCAAVVLAWALPAAALVSSNGGDDPPFTGLYINDFVGATTFYDAGYTGTRAVIANVEAGHIWDGHETLGHVTTFFEHADAAGDYDVHATAVGHTLGGRHVAGNPQDYQLGIAYGAELWSGAIATSWGGGTSFFVSNDTVEYAYDLAMVTGIGGNTADVVTSSWGAGSDNDGDGQYSRLLDAITVQTGKVVVFAAGNGGPDPDTLSGPGSAFNTIAVGALASDTSTPAYDDVASFSSRSPTDFFLPDNAAGTSGATVAGARAAIDIAEPGQNLTLAYYGGTTGSNTGGTDITGGAGNYYVVDAAGTSFAAPITAGGAALICDAGYDVFGGGQAIDGRVVKAVLLNSATKTTTHPWDNGQQVVGGVITTTQSLDYTVGAGRMDLEKGYDQYLSGTGNVAGLGGGNVEAVGWDYGQVDEGTPNDYFITTQLQGGTMLTATLTWFVDRAYDADTHSGTYESFDDLDLEIWSADAGGTALTKLAESISDYNTMEHLHFELADDMYVLVRVVWDEEVYDFVSDANAETYGLAWYGTPVPEPATVGLIALGGLALLRRRRRG